MIKCGARSRSPPIIILGYNNKFSVELESSLKIPSYLHSLLCRRVFIEFERHHLSHANTTDVAQPVQEAVYIALKKRHERGRFFLYAKDDHPGQERRNHSSLMGQGAGMREHGASARGERSAELEAVGSGGGSESESAGVVRALPAASLPDQGTLQIMITEVWD